MNVPFFSDFSHSFAPCSSCRCRTVTLALIALFKMAETTGVVEVAHLGAEADDAADRLDGNHQGGTGEADAAGVALEQGKQQLLLRDMPAAVAGREAVGVVPAQLIDALLQTLFHPVGTMLGNDTT